MIAAKKPNLERFYGYKVTPDADATGTHRMGYIRATYAELERLLGKPEEGDGYKVSGEWTITSGDCPGSVITLYDWKSTALYDESLPSVAEFRASPKARTFNVGGNNPADVLRFIEVLSIELDEQPEPKPKPARRKATSKTKV
jgi:hypothetical protein